MKKPGVLGIVFGGLSILLAALFYLNFKITVFGGGLLAIIFSIMGLALSAVQHRRKKGAISKAGIAVGVAGVILSVSVITLFLFSFR